MASTVDEAIYRMTVQGKDSVDAAAKSVDNLAVSEEKLTRATRSNTDSMDRLLGKLDPRIRAEQQLQRTLEQIHRLEQEGLATTQQSAQALSAATANYNTALQRINGTKAQDTFLGAGNAAKLSAFQIQNLSFQLQDVGQALLTGQPLFRTFIQQGSQIAQIFGPGVGLRGAISALGQGILSFVTNPLNLAVLAFAATTAAAQFLFNVLRTGWGGGVEEVMKRHDETIKQIKDDWDKAGDASERYGKRTQNAINFSGQAQLAAEQKLLQSQLQSIPFDLGSGFAKGARPTAGAYQSTFGALADAVQKFRDQAVQGKGDILGFNEEVQRIALADPSNQRLQRIARDLLATTAAATTTEQKIKDLGQSLAKYGSGQVQLFDLSKGLAESFSKGAEGAGNYAKSLEQVTVALKAAETVGTATQRKRESEAQTLIAVGAQLRAARQEYDDLTKAVAQAGSTANVTSFFPDIADIKGATAAVGEGVNKLNQLFDTFRRGEVSPRQLASGIDSVRRALVDSGLGVEKVNRFIDAFVQAQLQVTGLKDRINALTQAVNQIPNQKVITISYQVTGGGAVSVSRPAESFTGGLNPNPGASTIPTASLINVNDFLGTGSSGISNGNSFGGPRAAGGPVSGGSTYLVGEQGPELVTVHGSGYVTDAARSAMIMGARAGGGPVGSPLDLLAGGASYLNRIEENTFRGADAAERALTFLDTLTSEVKLMRSQISSISINSGGGSSSSGGSRSGGSSSGGGGKVYSFNDPRSPYYWNPSVNIGGAQYDPVADYVYNHNPAALSSIAGSGYSPYEATPWNNPGDVSRATFQSNADIAAMLKQQYGYANGGIAYGPSIFGEDGPEAAVPLPDGRSIPVTMRGQGGGKTVNFHGGINISVRTEGGAVSQRSLQAIGDKIRRAVKDAGDAL